MIAITCRRRGSVNLRKNGRTAMGGSVAVRQGIVEPPNGHVELGSVRVVGINSNLP